MDQQHSEWKDKAIHAELQLRIEQTQRAGLETKLQDAVAMLNPAQAPSHTVDMAALEKAKKEMEEERKANQELTELTSFLTQTLAQVGSQRYPKVPAPALHTRPSAAQAPVRKAEPSDLSGGSSSSACDRLARHETRRSRRSPRESARTRKRGGKRRYAAPAPLETNCPGTHYLPLLTPSRLPAAAHRHPPRLPTQDLVSEIEQIAQRTAEYEQRFGTLMHVGGYGSHPSPSAERINGRSSPPGRAAAWPSSPLGRTAAWPSSAFPRGRASPSTTLPTGSAATWPAMALAQRPQTSLSASACPRPTGGSTAAAKGGAGGQRSLRSHPATGAAHGGYEIACRLPRLDASSSAPSFDAMHGPEWAAVGSGIIPLIPLLRLD